jgi:hypothetical protein
MFIGFTHGNTNVRANIEVPPGVDQFAIIEKIKEFLGYWTQFEKAMIHIETPPPQEPVPTQQ